MGFLNPKLRLVLAIGTLIGVVFLAGIALRGAGVFSGDVLSTATPETSIFPPVGENAPGATHLEDITYPTADIPTGTVYGCQNSNDPVVVHELGVPTQYQGHVCSYNAEKNTCSWETGAPAVCVIR